MSDSLSMPPQTPNTTAATAASTTSTTGTPPSASFSTIGAPPKARFDEATKQFVVRIETGLGTSKEIAINKLHGVQLNGAALESAGKTGEVVAALEALQPAINEALTGTSLREGKIKFMNNYTKAAVSDAAGNITVPEREIKMHADQITTIQKTTETVQRFFKEMIQTSKDASNVHQGTDAATTNAASQAALSFSQTDAKDIKAAAATPAFPTPKTLLETRNTILKSYQQLSDQVLDHIEKNKDKNPIPNFAREGTGKIKGEIDKAKAHRQHVSELYSSAPNPKLAQELAQMNDIIGFYEKSLSPGMNEKDLLSMMDHYLQKPRRFNPTHAGNVFALLKPIAGRQKEGVSDSLNKSLTHLQYCRDNYRDANSQLQSKYSYDVPPSNPFSSPAPSTPFVALEVGPNNVQQETWYSGAMRQKCFEADQIRSEIEVSLSNPPPDWNNLISQAAKLRALEWDTGILLQNSGLRSNPQLDNEKALNALLIHKLLESYRSSFSLPLNPENLLKQKSGLLSRQPENPKECVAAAQYILTKALLTTDTTGTEVNKAQALLESFKTEFPKFYNAEIAKDPQIAHLRKMFKNTLQTSPAESLKSPAAIQNIQVRLNGISNEIFQSSADTFSHNFARLKQGDINARHILSENDQKIFPLLKQQAQNHINELRQLISSTPKSDTDTHKKLANELQRITNYNTFYEKMLTGSYTNRDILEFQAKYLNDSLISLTSEEILNNARPLQPYMDQLKASNDPQDKILLNQFENRIEASKMKLTGSIEVNKKIAFSNNLRAQIRHELAQANPPWNKILASSAELRRSQAELQSHMGNANAKPEIEKMNKFNDDLIASVQKQFQGSLKDYPSVKGYKDPEAHIKMYEDGLLYLDTNSVIPGYSHVAILKTALMESFLAVPFNLDKFKRAQDMLGKLQQVKPKIFQEHIKNDSSFAFLAKNIGTILTPKHLQPQAQAPMEEAEAKDLSRLMEEMGLPASDIPIKPSVAPPEPPRTPLNSDACQKGIDTITHSLDRIDEYAGSQNTKERLPEEDYYESRTNLYRGINKNLNQLISSPWENLTGPKLRNFIATTEKLITQASGSQKDEGAQERGRILQGNNASLKSQVSAHNTELNQVVTSLNRLKEMFSQELTRLTPPAPQPPPLPSPPQQPLQVVTPIIAPPPPPPPISPANPTT